MNNLDLMRKKTIGRWGRMHRTYLEEYHPILYQELLKNGKLIPVLSKKNKEAINELQKIVLQMKANGEIPHRENCPNDEEWMKQINLSMDKAEKIVKKKIIFVLNQENDE